MLEEERVQMGVGFGDEEGWGRWAPLSLSVAQELYFLKVLFFCLRTDIEAFLPRWDPVEHP